MSLQSLYTTNPKDIFHYILLALAISYIFPIFMNYSAPLITMFGSDLTFVVSIIVVALFLFILDKPIHLITGAK